MSAVEIIKIALGNIKVSNMESCFIYIFIFKSIVTTIGRGGFEPGHIFIGNAIKCQLSYKALGLLSCPC